MDLVGISRRLHLKDKAHSKKSDYTNRETIGNLLIRWGFPPYISSFRGYSNREAKTEQVDTSYKKL